MPSDVALMSNPTSRAQSTRSHAWSKVVSDGIGAIARAIEETHLTPPRLQQAMDDAARSSARAQDGNGACGGVKGRHGCAQMLQEAGTVGVVGPEAIPLQPQRVGNPDGAGTLGAGVRRGEGRPLMRDRDIAANQVLRAQAAEKGHLFARRDSAARVAALDGVPLEPIAVDEG